jgi:hypothetical protein
MFHTKSSFVGCQSLGMCREKLSIAHWGSVISAGCHQITYIISERSEWH